VRDIPSVPTHASGFNDYSAPGWGFLLRKAGYHAGCFEFVDVNKIRRQRMITGFVEKKSSYPAIRVRGLEFNWKTFI